MRNLDLFSGIGGFTYAAERLVGGITTTQFVENDKFCQKILKKHWPNIPIHDDIRTFKAERGQFDLFTIGFPCQDLSSAGRQRGIGEGTRSGLFYESIRLLREVRPRFALFENVRNLLSHEGGETFQEVLFQIAKSGDYEIEWAVVSARDMGACHLRQRIWILAYANGYGSPSTEGLRVNGEADSGTQERQNQTGQSEGSSKSRNSEVVQRSTELTNPKCNRLQREVWSRLHRATWSTQNIRRINKNWRQYESKPVLCRGDDGLRNRVDRLKGLGNSIVPNCAAVPLQRIKDLNEHFSTTT